MPAIDLTEEARRALLAADWPEASLLPDALGASSLSPRWSVVLTWSEHGAMLGEPWKAYVQFASITLAIRAGHTAERALSAATLAAAKRVQQATLIDEDVSPRMPTVRARRSPGRSARTAAARAQRLFR